MRELYRYDEGFSLVFDTLPFSSSPSLVLRWGSWSTRVCYEEGERVLDDSRYIQETLGESVPFDVSGIGKRIRVVFWHDDEREYTNQIIDMMQYLCGIEGAVVFDPQKNSIMTMTSG